MKVNGSLVFDASSASEIQNLRVEKVTTLPAHAGLSDQGRVIYNSTTNVTYVGDATTWVAIATGGNAAALQTEVDAVETALGAGITSAGLFSAAGFPAQAGLNAPSSFTDAINQLAAYATSKDQLSELTDVAIAGLTTGQYLKYDGAKWANDTLTLTDVTNVTISASSLNGLTGLTATATDLNKLTGLTTSAADYGSIAGYAAEGVTATEFGYITNLTSDAQAQLNNKQPLDAGLTSLASLAGTGFVVETADNVFTNRALTQPAAGFTITNADAVAGSPTFALANDLAALEGLATTGIIVRTGDGTAVTRTITGTTGRIVVADGNGVISEPTLDLATVSNSGAGTFLKLATDTYGRVTGTTAVVTGDITTLVDGTYVNVTGDTMTGPLAMGTNKITGLGAPTSANDATTKTYVDSLVASGATWRNPIRDPALVDVVATQPVAPVDSNTYIAYGTFPQTWSGTIVNQGSIVHYFGGVYTVSGTLGAGDRFIIAGETGTIGATLSGVGFFNTDLIQYVSGDPALFASWATPEGRAAAAGGTEIAQGITVLDSDPASYHFGHTYLYNAIGNNWVEIAGPGSIGAGTGLAYAGNTLNVNMGAGIAQLPSDEVGIDLFGTATSALILTSDGVTRGTGTNDALALLLKAAGGLAQDGTGLRINTGSVANAMLTNPKFVVNADSGSDDLFLGDVLHIIGVTTQGTSVLVAESPVGQTNVTITVADASSTQKGVATFSTADFTVTAGDVVIKAAGVDNVQLANSSVTITGSTGSDVVALGESMAFIGGAGGEVSTVMGANSLAISVRDATATLKGVASFDASFFTVTAGAVVLTSTLDSLMNVSLADAAAVGDILTKTAGDWQPVTRDALVGSTSIAAHNDVTLTSPLAGETLVYAAGQFINKKIYHLEAVVAPATSWTVTHNLGQKYCNVTVVDSTDNVVIPQSIVFGSATQLTVTFNTGITGKVIVMGIA